MTEQDFPRDRSDLPVGLERPPVGIDVPGLKHLDGLCKVGPELPIGVVELRRDTVGKIQCAIEPCLDRPDDCRVALAGLDDVSGEIHVG